LQGEVLGNQIVLLGVDESHHRYPKMEVLVCLWRVWFNYLNAAEHQGGEGEAIYRGSSVLRANRH